MDRKLRISNNRHKLSKQPSKKWRQVLRLKLLQANDRDIINYYLLLEKIVVKTKLNLQYKSLS